MSDHDDDGYETPDHGEFQHDLLGHAGVRGGMTVGELVEQYDHVGTSAVDVHGVANIYAEVLTDDDCTVFMSLAGAMAPTGMRKVVSDLIRDGHVDVLVATSANLTHDAVEVIGGKHHHERAHPDPSSFPSHGSREHGVEHHGERTEYEYDKVLRDGEADHIYNVYFPQEHFALFESYLRSEVFPAPEEEGTVSITNLCCELGRVNSGINDRGGVDEDAGIAAAAYEADVSIYCPMVQDSVLGLQAWTYLQTSPFSLDALADMTPLTDLAYDTDTADCLLVGGGVPKNFTLQTIPVTPDAYDYGVQTTVDPATTGGFSGATFDEVHLWGKPGKDARNTTVLDDATIMFPLLIAIAYRRIE